MYKQNNNLVLSFRNFTNEYLPFKSIIIIGKSSNNCDLFIAHWFDDEIIGSTGKKHYFFSIQYNK